MSWLGILGRAAWDLVGHPTEANPGEDKWIAEHQQEQRNEQPQHHEQQHTDHSAHHDSVGHDYGHSDPGPSGGW